MPPTSSPSGPTAWANGLLHQNGLLTALALALVYPRMKTTPLNAVLLGLFVEGGRTAVAWLVDRMKFRPNIQAYFHQGDPVYDYLMCFLLKEKLWQRTREFSVVAKTSQRKWAVKESEISAMSHWYPLGSGKSSGVEPENRTEDWEAEQGSKLTQFVPRWTGNAHLIKWHDIWIDIAETELYSPLSHGPENGLGYIKLPELRLTFFTTDPSVLSHFVKEMRATYIEATEQTKRVVIHLPSSGQDWRYGGPRFTSQGGIWGNVKSKPLRPVNTVSLEEGVLEDLIIDVTDFLASERWYTTIGIPYKKGYLFHGPPGTGKTSTIYALAGELGLEIYTASLSGHNMDDQSLEGLAAAVPKRSIFLIEDIDCAFPSRNDMDEEDLLQERLAMTPFFPPPSRQKSNVTMSGLLNVLDGIQSDEGRLFFATTNYPERLDAALLRPGRIDRQVEYKRASGIQVRAMFDHFFPSSAVTHFNSSSELQQTSELFTPLLKQPIPLEQPLASLAELFVSSIPSGEFSTAELQGHLLVNKWDPHGAAHNAAGWVERTRKEKKAREDASTVAKAKRQKRLRNLLPEAKNNVKGESQPHDLHGQEDQVATSESHEPSVSESNRQTEKES